MTPLRETTIAARVPLGLRTDLEALLVERQAAGDHRPDGGELDLSTLIRRACAAYVDVNLGASRQGPSGTLELGSLNGRPRSHRGGPATERQAAEGAWPNANTQRRRALEFVRNAAEHGLTGDELDVLLDAGIYSGRRRLSELKLAGWVEVKRGTHTDIVTGTVRLYPVHRNTRAGNPAEVYVLTPAARIRLAEEAKQL